MSDGNFIIFDTETTGFNPDEGHRIVEIGALKMENWFISDDNYCQLYINPERDMPEEAFKVHGLSNAFLQDKPTFNDVAQEFIDFIGTELPIIAHNANFDMKFINHHLQEIGYDTIPKYRVIDSLIEARKQFPSQQNSLDALCRRFHIDHSSRQFHGALLDAKLLSEVWVELQGGRQNSLKLAPREDTKSEENQELKTDQQKKHDYSHRKSVITYATQEELELHQEMMKKFLGLPFNVIH